MKAAINQFNTYTTASNIDSEGCSGLCFKNEGNTTLLINNMFSLAPGAVWSINQTCCDTVDETQYTVQFLPSEVDAAAPITSPAEAPYTTTDPVNKLVVVRIGIAIKKC